MSPWDFSNFRVKFQTMMTWLYTVSGFHKIARNLRGSAPGLPWNISRDALRCGASHQEVSICSESPSVFTEKEKMGVSMLVSSPDRIWAPVSRRPGEAMAAWGRQHRSNNTHSNQHHSEQMSSDFKRDHSIDEGSAKPNDVSVLNWDLDIRSYGRSEVKCVSLSCIKGFCGYHIRQ